jgi:hypothetical protein
VFLSLKERKNRDYAHHTIVHGKARNEKLGADSNDCFCMLKIEREGGFCIKMGEGLRLREIRTEGWVSRAKLAFVRVYHMDEGGGWDACTWFTQGKCT